MRDPCITGSKPNTMVNATNHTTDSLIAGRLCSRPRVASAQRQNGKYLLLFTLRWRCVCSVNSGGTNHAAPGQRTPSRDR